MGLNLPAERRQALWPATLLGAGVSIATGAASLVAPGVRSDVAVPMLIATQLLAIAGPVVGYAVGEAFNPGPRPDKAVSLAPVAAPLPGGGAGGGP